MSDRWVNARITLLFPMEDISPDDPAEVKMGALEIAHDDLLDRLRGFDEIPGFVSSAQWEDAS